MRTSREISIVVEPDASHGDQEIVERLKASGATRIEVLAPGYISASLPVDNIEQLRGIGHLTLKRQKEAISTDR